MRKYALRLLVWGGVAVCFLILILILTLLEVASMASIIICLAGIAVSLGAAFHALAKIAESGNLMTDMRKLLSE